ncbi:ral guanine nucleotide dissociation stimulator-like 3 [Grus americana]|uniref:ral guanine nucleotide dissociation stimulator-like 3 n=1 Tax=Grus americana TaxID=9117 RepID=UPI002407CEB9|nr:ral guanine nucleotide dissociation stimulator-like 3 [Grus americana]
MTQTASMRSAQETFLRARSWKLTTEVPRSLTRWAAFSPPRPQTLPSPKAERALGLEGDAARPAWVPPLPGGGAPRRASCPSCHTNKEALAIIYRDTSSPPQQTRKVTGAERPAPPPAPGKGHGPPPTPSPPAAPPKRMSLLRDERRPLSALKPSRNRWGDIMFTQFSYLQQDPWPYRSLMLLLIFLVELLFWIIPLEVIIVGKAPALSSVHGFCYVGPFKVDQSLVTLH